MKKGFTLIELLVVVLIIGILAAIALPMYTKTVEKSRAAEGVLLSGTLDKSLQRYVMENGLPSAQISGKTLFESLDIELPGEWHSGNNNLIVSKSFNVSATCNSTECSSNVARGTIGNTMYVLETAYSPSGDFSGFNLEEGYGDAVNGNFLKSCVYMAENYKYLCKQLEGQGFVSIEYQP